MILRYFYNYSYGNPKFHQVELVDTEVSPSDPFVPSNIRFESTKILDVLKWLRDHSISKAQTRVVKDLARPSMSRPTNTVIVYPDGRTDGWV